MTPTLALCGSHNSLSPITQNGPELLGWPPCKKTALGHSKYAVFFYVQALFVLVSTFFMFRRQSGRPNVQYFKKAASTAFANGALVYFNGTGEIIPADTTSGAHIGVILREVLATDDDYASETYVPVDVIDATTRLEVDVTNGDLAAADVGNTCDIEAGGASIDPDLSAKDVVTIVDFISASKAVVIVNALAGHVDVATT